MENEVVADGKWETVEANAEQAAILQQSMVDEEKKTYAVYVLSIDPGAVNTGWSLFAFDDLSMYYVRSDTNVFARFGNNDSVTMAQIAQDADMFVKMLQRRALFDIPQGALIVVLIENQFVNPSSKFRAGLNLRAMEVALLTAFTCLFRSNSKYSGICQTVMPRTVNAALHIDGSKATNPNFKWQHLVDRVAVTDTEGNAVDFTKISKHEADTVWQTLWYAQAYIKIKLPFRATTLLSKTGETKQSDAPKKRSRKTAAKRPQASQPGPDAGNDGASLTGSASSRGDHGHQQVQQN